ncbi:MAG: tetratricopeptide repeat protein [Capnocytophaga sp.]|nr:tetratricopeptide repeat protein [Capnocytophaga sp.]
MFFLLCVAQAYGQLPYKDLLHKSYYTHSQAYDSLQARFLTISSSAEAKRIAKEIKQFAKKNKDPHLSLMSDYWYAYYVKDRCKENPDSTAVIVALFQDVIKRSKREKNEVLATRVLFDISEYYWIDVQNYELAFENYIQTGKNMAELSLDTFPESVYIYGMIAERFYRFKDYENAIYYASKTLPIAVDKNNWWFKWNATNTLGVCYQQTEKYDMSDLFLKRAADESLPYSKEGTHYAISMGNIGENRYLQNRYEEALPLLELDWDNALRIRDSRLIVNSGSLIADILVSRSELEKAKSYLDVVEKHLLRDEYTSRNVKFYTAMRKWYMAQEKYAEAGVYQDSMAFAANERDRRFNLLLLMRAQQKNDLRNLEIEKENTSSARLQTITITIVMILIIIILGALFYKIRGVLIRKNKEKELELDKAKTELEYFTNRLTQRIQMTEEETSDKALNVDVNKLLTHEDWQLFLKSFNKVHPDFIKRLKDKVAGISQSEIRLVSLAKLGFSHIEIGKILGISPQSSRVAWHRLKKKIDEEEVSLEEFARTV